MHPDTPSSWFCQFLRTHGLPHTKFNNLRHFHGSILVKMGMDFNSIADQLGHADIQMLVRLYSHNITKKQHEVSNYMSKALLDGK